MMFKRIMVFILISTFTFSFYSCSDDDGPSGNDVKSDNLLPMNPGSHWIYDSWDLDSSNTRKVENGAYKDSTVNVGTEVVLGKTASLFKTFRWENDSYKEVSSQYFYTENEIVYAHSSIFNSLVDFEQITVPLPIEIEEQWFVIADPGGESWDIYNRTFASDTFEIQDPYKAVITGEFFLKGKKAGVEDITIMGTTHKAQKFELTLTIDGEAAVESIPVPMELATERKMYLWFVNDIGLVRTLVDYLQVDLPFLGDMPQLGFESMLNNYTIIE